uniref:Uncharacterized protein n=1 Tax=Opuntia streptacantha TaxID=393608 RepID=A0A7C9ED07_OPUST
MDALSEEPIGEGENDQYPLLVEPCDGHMDEEHIIDIDRGSEASSSDSSNFQFTRGSSFSHDGRSMDSVQASVDGPSSTSFSPTSTGGPTFTRRSEGIGRHNWSPFYSGIWISIELIFTLSQITASLTVLCLSRHERPRILLSTWVVGYTAGCFASLPVLYWQFLNRNQGSESGALQATQASHQANSASGQISYVTISLTPPSEQEDRSSMAGRPYEGRIMGTTNARIGFIMDHFKMALDCFFAVWFVVGNVWIFGGHASAAEAPNLYRLCILYLTLSCIGYAMPFILCAVICCCLPCIISVLGIREELSQGRGASEEAISALLTYRFKVKKGDGGCTGEPDSEEGGIVAAGTEKERLISREDAVSHAV